MDCQCYSKLHRLLRVSALVKKFAAQFKLLVSHVSVDWTVSAVDMESTEKDWIRDCHKQLTTEAKFGLWKNQLDLFLDKDNIWQCGGRIKKVHACQETSTILLF